MENIITVEHVTKRFGQATVLNDINVSFEKGKIHGLIGRNGSGKTVLMKCIWLCPGYRGKNNCKRKTAWQGY